jgi:hypothetical protein
MNRRELTASAEPDLMRIARERPLQYPVETKTDFIAQLTSWPGSIMFRGQVYPVEFAARLIPEFFFPLRDEEDLMAKATELLIARGLLSMPTRGDTRPQIER